MVFDFLRPIPLDDRRLFLLSNSPPSFPQQTVPSRAINRIPEISSLIRVKMDSLNTRATPCRFIQFPQIKTVF